MLAVANHLLLTIIFTGAGYIKAFQEIEVRVIGIDGLATKIFGFTSTDEVAVLLLIFAAVMLLLTAASLIQNASREGHVPMIRLEATGGTPELSLHRGHRYHLFNSHIWSTGQDA